MKNEVLLVSSSRSTKSSDINRRGNATRFKNIECFSCGSNIAYLIYQKNISEGFCPECKESWLESS